VVAGYERALDRTLAFCVALARLDIDERVVKVNTTINAAARTRRRPGWLTS
jgi:hypothetical protein